MELLNEAAILPTLNEKNSDLGKQLDTEFTELIAELGKYKQNDVYVSYTKLTKEHVRDVSQQLSVLSESMAQTADIFQ